MSMLVPFAPWIGFSLVSRADWRLGLAAGLAVQIAVLVVNRRRRLGVIDGAMLVFLLVMGGYALMAPDSPIRDHVATLSAAWLAVAAAGSIAVGHPFTIDISVDRVAADVARTARFRAVNRTVSAVWAACFAAMAAAGLIAALTGVRGFQTVGTVGALVIAVAFTTRYPDHATPRSTDRLAGQPS